MRFVKENIRTVMKKVREYGDTHHLPTVYAKVYANLMNAYQEDPKSFSNIIVYIRSDSDKIPWKIGKKAIIVRSNGCGTVSEFNKFPCTIDVSESDINRYHGLRCDSGISSLLSAIYTANGIRIMYTVGTYDFINALYIES